MDPMAKPVFVGVLAGTAFSGGSSHQHKKAGMVFCKKSHAAKTVFQLRNRRRAARSIKQMSNLVNGVVTRALADTDATKVRVGACGTKLLNRLC